MNLDKIKQEVKDLHELDSSIRTEALTKAVNNMTEHDFGYPDLNFEDVTSYVDDLKEDLHNAYKLLQYYKLVIDKKAAQ